MKFAFVEKYFLWLVAALLIAAFFVAVFSSMGDSPTNDEIAHIPAGYSYLAAQDYRLNPEHPPLVKDLAAIPLLFLDVQFPFDHRGWTQETFGQWIVGEEFLYNSENNPDQILFWARLPMIVLFLALGLFLFYWARKLAGMWVAFLVLILYLFSPTFLAHGRLVTTDVGAAFGFVVSIFFFLRFVEGQNLKNAVWAGIALGIALLMKFSTVLLFPFFVFLAGVYVLVQKDKKSMLWSYAKQGIAIVLAMLIVVGVVYEFHLINYPIERHAKDAKVILAEAYETTPEEVVFTIPENPILRPYAHYALGFLRTTRRVASITPEFLMGQVSGSGWWYYFPVLYLFKLPLAFHAISILSLFAGFFALKKNTDLGFQRIRFWVRDNFSLFALASFVVFYAGLAIATAISIGIRHLLPILPFLYILVALGIKRWVSKNQVSTIQQQKGKIAIVVALLGWYVVSSLSAFPDFLSHYNEAVGGSTNGYKIALSSNYDWGQDVKRLKNWVEQNNVETIYVDIFGKGNPEKHYLKERHVQWKESFEWLEASVDPDGLKREYNRETFPKGNYFAVSANLVFGGGWDGEQIVPHYAWLQDYTPINRAGRSIFIYYIDK